MVADAEYGPVHSLRLPNNTPCSGRYALFRPAGDRGYPNFEDNILIARGPGEAFRPAFVTHVPFDEPELELMDDPERPEIAVVYQSCTLAWTTDGGRTLLGPPEQPAGLFNLSRFGDRRIATVTLGDDHLLIRFGEGDAVMRARFLEARSQERRDRSARPLRFDERVRRWWMRVRGARKTARTFGIEPAHRSLPLDELPLLWRVPLDGGAAEPMTRARWSRWGGWKAKAEPLLRVEEDTLWARASPGEEFTQVPLVTLAQRLDECPDDFFGGGSEARLV